MLVLDKMSMPGWQFKSDHIEHIFWLLNQCVCDSCKLTKDEYEKSAEEVDAEYPDDYGEGINPYTFCEFKPETYDSFSMLEKVEWLMGTACGCEFDFYDEDDGSDLIFTEIRS